MLTFATFTDGDLREAVRPAHDDEDEAHVATLCSDGNVIWYTEWCSLEELGEVQEEFVRVWKERTGG
jgi:hypothetical protein